MTSICQLENIYWKSPLDRFLWEALCGRGGGFLLGVAVVLVIIYIFIKITED
jgi:hypothetical protein